MVLLEETSELSFQLMVLPLPQLSPHLSQLCLICLDLACLVKSPLTYPLPLSSLWILSIRVQIKNLSIPCWVTLNKFLNLSMP